MSELTKRIANLSPAQLEMLAKRMRKGNDAARVQSIPRRAAPAAPPPLSFAQQRMWFLDQMEPGNASYNIPAAVRLKGELNVEALRRTLRQIVMRHESLRTTFPVVDGKPVQYVSPTERLELAVTDLRGVPEQERERESLRLATEEARRPFDLAAGPLFRAGLLRLDEEEYVALLTMHHIVSDGWSTDVLVREVTMLYTAQAAGQRSPLAELPIQYADFAVWQSERLSDDLIEEHLAYWRRKLANAPAMLELPAARPRPAVQSHDGARHRFALSTALSERLKALGRREGVTLFTTLLAAFKTLLHRYTGQDDVIVGSPVANRNQTETEPLIGLFVNTLAIRTDLSGDPTFRELLLREREEVLGAHAHRDLPFEKIIEELQPERSLSHSPVFQVEFFLENAQRATLKLPGLELIPLTVESGAAKFDLTLAMEEVGEQIGGMLIYNTDVFEEATVARMARHFEVLLEGIVADPERRLLELPLLTDSEARRLTAGRSGAAREFPHDRCIHELFERQAEHAPGQLAVVYENKRVSYGELNRRANRLARYLRRAGVGPEVRVALVMERSAEVLVAILGVLKAGGAYVPLDPEYPRARLSFMVEDSGASALVADRGLVEGLVPPGVRVISLEEEAEAIARESAETVESGAIVGNLAYVIYTSGSTGQPKGVAITHRSALNLLHALSTSVYAGQSTENLRVSLNAPFSFDASVQQFLMLLRGATLYVLSRETRADSEELLRYLREQRVEVFDCTPSHLRMLLRAGLLEGEGCGPRKFLVAGEAVDAALWQELSEAQGDGSGREFYNIYGPTECTVDATWYCISAERQRPVVGLPLANYQVFILDRRQCPLPSWVTGEIYIGGEGLARGYLGRADLTAERFVPHPYASEAGARLYRTGDLGRQLPDGSIEYMGRADEQVKVRGYRIELGEVEAVLRQCPGVKDAAAAVRDEACSDKRLVGYLIGHVGVRVPEADEIRAHMRQHVPEFMIPSAFVVLEGMPLTPSGKVDRKALPAPKTARPGLASAFAPPRTPLEELVAGIWAQVLGVDAVGVEDNFFELGGHSLLATQVVSRVREAFRVELPLKRLFESPTVAALSKHVEAEMGAGRQGAKPIERVTRDRPLPLSFAQERLWFLDQLKRGNPVFNLPNVVCMTGRLNVAALKQTLDEVVSRHEVLRTTFALDDAWPVQVIAPASRLTLEVEDLSGAAEGDREAEMMRRAEEEAARPFDLDDGPLMRARLLRLSEEEHVLLFTMHHVVSDEWSMTVLLKEVAELYGAFSRGEGSPLAELPIQYADFAVWQRESMSGEALESQLSYWREQLRDISTLALPTDRPRPPVQTIDGAKHSFTLPPGLRQALNELSRAEGATLFMTLLAAFQVLLSRYSGQPDVSVGTPVAGRNRVETEDLIGFFVNTLVMRADLSGDPSFAEFLKQVRETCIGAYAHQDVPFEKLVEELQPERDLSRAPLFQVMFLLQNEQRVPLEIPGVKLSSVERDNRMTNYDLGLSLADAGGEIVGELNYNTDLFDAATAARIASHFQVLLQSITADPRRRVSELPLLSGQERRALLREWNDTSADYPRDYCLHELFEAQEARTPDAVALFYEGEQSSYAELNRRANRLAHRLRTFGVGPDAPVGIFAERSTEMVVGMLAVLKAGGAYLPLEPSYPSERLAFMLEDAGVRVLLTQGRFASKLPQSAARVVLLDAGPQLAESAESEQNPRVVTVADNLAYVIYTSGSTGRPKGVMISHRGICNRLFWMQDAYRIGASDSILQKTPFSFDVSVWEFFWPLMTGARLVVARPEGHQDSAYLASLIAEQGITLLHFVPSMLRVFLQEPELEKCACVKRVICSGEALPFDLQEQFLESAGAELHNLYGPTEASVDVTYWKCEPGYERRTVPIGRPIANTQIYIVDRHGQPSPVGVEGELLIGGVGLARGYLKNAPLTAQRFVPDPFGDRPGARLYRTGDIARYLPDGQIEYVGRADNQVKVRGFRIELGEIEDTLNRHDAVRESVVVAAADGAGGKRLSAYVVSAGGRGVTAGELRDHLSATLPEYMTPSNFTFLDGLPLMPNGKVNRAALPASEQGRTDEDAVYVAPRTPLEVEVAAMWGDLLGVEQVGIHDNFFELGGHSLLLTQLASRIRKTFEVEVTLRDLFGAPTVVEMTIAISTKQLEQENTSEIADMLEELKHLSPDEVQAMLGASQD